MIYDINYRVFSVTFCLDDMSISESGVSKLLIITVWGSISGFRSNSISSVILETSMLSV